MNNKTLTMAVVSAGIIALSLNLLAEWLLNHKLVTEDFVISVALGVLVALAIFIIFRKRSRSNRA